MLLRIMASSFRAEAIIVSGCIVEAEEKLAFMCGWPWTKAELYADDKGWRMEIMKRARIPPSKKAKISIPAKAGNSQFEEAQVNWRHIGFSGSREGMTSNQKETLKMLLEKLRGGSSRCWFRHGDCIGADKEAHKIARLLNYSIIIHPPDKEELRAFCEDAFSVLPALPYLERNKMIVKKSDFLLAAPKDKENQRGGTWHTIDQAEEQGIPMRIIYPDGSFSKGRS